MNTYRWRVFCVIHKLSFLFTWQSFRIVDALTRSGFGYLGGEHREPGRGGAGLFLEASGKRVVDVLEPERAYGRAHQARGRRGEHSVEKRVVTGYFVNTLCAGKTSHNINFNIISHIRREGRKPDRILLLYTAAVGVHKFKYILRALSPRFRYYFHGGIIFLIP